MQDFSNEVPVLHHQSSMFAATAERRWVLWKYLQEECLIWNLMPPSWVDVWAEGGGQWLIVCKAAEKAGNLTFLEEIGATILDFSLNPSAAAALTVHWRAQEEAQTRRRWTSPGEETSTDRKSTRQSGSFPGDTQPLTPWDLGLMARSGEFTYLGCRLGGPRFGQLERRKEDTREREWEDGGLGRSRLICLNSRKTYLHFVGEKNAPCFFRA